MVNNPRCCGRLHPPFQTEAMSEFFRSLSNLVDEMRGHPDREVIGAATLIAEENIGMLADIVPFLESKVFQVRTTPLHQPHSHWKGWRPDCRAMARSCACVCVLLVGHAAGSCSCVVVLLSARRVGCACARALVPLLPCATGVWPVYGAAVCAKLMPWDLVKGSSLSAGAFVGSLVLVQPSNMYPHAGHILVFAPPAPADTTEPLVDSWCSIHIVGGL